MKNKVKFLQSTAMILVVGCLITNSVFAALEDKMEVEESHPHALPARSGPPKARWKSAKSSNDTPTSKKAKLEENDDEDLQILPEPNRPLPSNSSEVIEDAPSVLPYISYLSSEEFIEFELKYQNSLGESQSTDPYCNGKELSQTTWKGGPRPGSLENFVLNSLVWDIESAYFATQLNGTENGHMIKEEYASLLKGKVERLSAFATNLKKKDPLKKTLEEICTFFTSIITDKKLLTMREFKSKLRLNRSWCPQWDRLKKIFTHQLDKGELRLWFTVAATSIFASKKNHSQRTALSPFLLPEDPRDFSTKLNDWKMKMLVVTWARLPDSFKFPLGQRILQNSVFKTMSEEWKFKFFSEMADFFRLKKDFQRAMDLYAEAFKTPVFEKLPERTQIECLQKVLETSRCVRNFSRAAELYEGVIKRQTFASTSDEFKYYIYLGVRDIYSVVKRPDIDMPAVYDKIIRNPIFKSESELRRFNLLGAAILSHVNRSNHPRVAELFEDLYNNAEFRKLDEAKRYTHLKRAIKSYGILKNKVRIAELSEELITNPLFFKTKECLDELTLFSLIIESYRLARNFQRVVDVSEKLIENPSFNTTNLTFRVDVFLEAGNAYFELKDYSKAKERYEAALQFFVSKDVPAFRNSLELLIRICSENIK